MIGANDNNRKDLKVMEDNGLDDNGEGILIMVQVIVRVPVEVGRDSDGEQSCSTATVTATNGGGKLKPHRYTPCNHHFTGQYNNNFSSAGSQHTSVLSKLYPWLCVRTDYKKKGGP